MDPQLLTALVAFIAPLAALGGVLLGQRMARTTTREQIAAQERQLELTRAREDTHRFTDRKQEVYAEFLASSLREINGVEQMYSRLKARLEESRNSLTRQPLREVYQSILQDENIREQVTEKLDKMWTIYSHLLLVAPNSVQDLAILVRKKISASLTSLASEWKPDVVQKIGIEALEARAELMNAMRKDLGTEG